MECEKAFFCQMDSALEFCEFEFEWDCSMLREWNAENENEKREIMPDKERVNHIHD